MAKKAIDSRLGASLLEEVQDFLYMEDDCVDRLTAWAHSRCSSFTSRDPRQAEQSLKNYKLYEDYCQLFESMIQDFLTSRGVKIAEFYDAAREQYRLVEERKIKMPLSVTTGSVLLSLSDYFTFAEMMYEVNCGGDIIFCPPLIAYEVDSSIDIAEEKLGDVGCDEEKK